MKRDYIAIVKSATQGRYNVIAEDTDGGRRWHSSVSRKSAIRLIRLMKDKEIRKFEKYESKTVEQRWLYWWF